MDEKPSIAVIGGTGNLGLALARRYAQAGFDVTIGSRDAGKAEAAAEALRRELGVNIHSGANSAAARDAQVIILTVPFASHEQILTEIRADAAGKLLIDATAPLVPPRVARVQLPPEGCAALITQRILGEQVTVASAFQNVAAHKLARGEALDCDVLVFCDHKDARARVVKLVQAIGLRGIHAGPLANSAAAEALTSVLIFINKTYKVDGSGIQITGKLEESQD